MCDCCIIRVFSIFFYSSQESAAESAASEENAASQKTDKTGKQVTLGTVSLRVLKSDHANGCFSALLEEELKTKDEKINKVKAVAIKAKKELDISKKEVEFKIQN